MKIVGVLIIRNAFEIPYPFVEAILSIYPAVDEMIVVDGGSTDGTYEVLLKLEKTYSKLKIIRIPEKPADHYENIDNAINFVMNSLDEGDWLWQVQADEGFHEKTIMKIRKMLMFLEAEGLIQPRLQVYWFRKIDRSYIYWTNRIVRVQRDIRWIDGADNIVRKGSKKAEKIGVPVNIPFYHFDITFPMARYRKMKRHLEWIGRKQRDRQKVINNVKKTEENNAHRWEYIKKIPVNPEIPALFKPLAYMDNYRVREELYDPYYLNKIYSKYGFEVY